MKKIFVFILGIISIICNNPISLDAQFYQPIITPTIEELATIGVTVKEGKIIIKNKIPQIELFELIIEGNNYNPSVDEKFPTTNFDFYPYYITDMDSVSGFMAASDKENEMKDDPWFQIKMFNNLVPLKIKQEDKEGKLTGYKLFWFTPTETFCMLLPQYNIKRRYTSDRLFMSDAAMELTDKELKKIGFVIDDEEMYLKTYMSDSYMTDDDMTFITEWYNKENDYGTMEIIGGGVKSTIKEKDNKNKDYDMSKVGYYIVRVTDINGHDNYLMSEYKGRVVPIFIRNSKRNYKNKKPVIIYLKYTPDLVKDLWNWQRKPDRYTVLIK